MHKPFIFPLIAIVSLCQQGLGQETEFLDPERVLAIWDFNAPEPEARPLSLHRGIALQLTGDASITGEGEGRSGGAGDHALDFGTRGSTALPTHAKVTGSSEKGSILLDLLNASNQEDTLSVSFWQRWHGGRVANSASIWFRSPSAGSGDRGMQAHVPWGNQVVYFDTVGCCDAPAKRLNGPAPGVDWGSWHHVALVKQGPSKQVWINGKRILSQDEGALPLGTDWTAFFLGQSPTEPQFAFHGLMDDIALLSVALNEGQIASLASGMHPQELALPRNEWPPRIQALSPVEGATFHPVDGGIAFSVQTVSPNQVSPGEIRLFLNGEDLSSSLNAAAQGDGWRINYDKPLSPNQNYHLRVVATDSRGHTSVLEWGFDTMDPMEARANLPLNISALGFARHYPETSEDENASDLAVDGKNNTYSVSRDTQNAYWELVLERPVLISRLELVPPPSIALGGLLAGTTLQVFDLEDRVLHASTNEGLSPGNTWHLSLPTPVYGRVIRVGLENGKRNAAGDFRVAMAELRLFGDPNPEWGPIRLQDIAVAMHPGAGEIAPASKAIDGNLNSYSQSADTADAEWLLTLDRTRRLHHIEIISPPGNASRRMQGLELEILDKDSRVVAATRVENPGNDRVWTFSPPEAVAGRFVRCHLPGTSRNGAGDHVIALAEVMLFTAENVALRKDAYMMRFHEGLPPSSHGNDGKYSTHTETTNRAVGAYWETDLGTEQALSLVRVVAADGFQSRMRHATVRVYDDKHTSVYAAHLEGRSPWFNIAMPGTIKARYIRVGFENKERSDPPGTFWHLGLKELQAFGRPVNTVGLRRFATVEKEIAQGTTTTLEWIATDLESLRIFPMDVSAGAFTGLDGHGRLEIQPDATTEYLLVGSAFDGDQILHTTVRVEGQVLPPRISEFVAINRLSLRDGRKNNPDWIEIHNPNDTRLQLGGYGLSDDPGQPMQWVFPNEVSIKPHGYLVVFASGRNHSRDAQGWLHANFSLQAEGEGLLLTKPDGSTTVDIIAAFPAQRHDLAYGRTLLGNWAFLEPTPGAANLAPYYQGWLEPAQFSKERGFHESPFNLVLNHPDTQAELLFSDDGTLPETPYSNPLRINGNATIRVDVRRPGYKAPRTQTHTYLSVEDTLNASYMRRSITGKARHAARIRKALDDLPVLCIAVPELPDDWNEREASVEVFLPGATPIQVNAGVNRFGGSWTRFAKKNYRLKFRPEYGARKLEIPLFDGFEHGIPVAKAFDEIDLRGGGHDMQSRGFYMSARFSEDTLLEMGSLNPHGRFVHVYFNGQYWGQYHARERLTDAFLADYLGGETEHYVNVRGNDNTGSGFVPGTPDPVKRTPWETVQRFKGNYERVRAWLDVPHLIDFMLMWSFGNAESEYRAAGPTNPGSGFKFWLGDADGHLRTASDRTGNAGPGGLFGALVSEAHPDFMTLLADRIHKHLFNQGAMTPARNMARLEERMQEITNSLVAECARWGYRTPENWESAARNAMENLFPSQTDTLISRLRGRSLYPRLSAPVLSQHGGVLEETDILTIQTDNAKLYYTVDGSDPRLAGGSIAPGARLLEKDEVGPSSLLLQGSTWQYLDGGRKPVPTWRDLSADTENWQRGKAPLGYGDSGMKTAMDFGGTSSDKAITYYFRHVFDIPDPETIHQLTLHLIRDDGAVIYLNGREVARDNLPGGTIEHDTRALSAAGGSDESTVRRFQLSSERLLTGQNILAAEVHQASPTSSDLRFDAWLETHSALELPIQGETWLKARSHDGSTWSALTEAQFLKSKPQAPAAGDLLITEIHYNPDGSDDFEFLEIMNVSPDSLDLSGVTVEDSVDYLFPEGSRIAPGQYLLLTEDRQAFAQRYQDPLSPYYYPGMKVEGNWTGQLNNDGEWIRLKSADGKLLASVRYNDGKDWPHRADGLGSSLEWKEPSALILSQSTLEAQMNRFANWQASSLFHGSPGRLDQNTPSLVIHEVVAHSDVGVDWIEIHNTGDVPVSLKDHFLSDHFEIPFRYAFDAQQSIEPGGYRVWHEEQLGFAFSELGGDILLTYAVDDTIVRFIDSRRIPAMNRETAYGRHTQMDGFTDFTALGVPTPNGTNATPRKGSVVLSEIMYHPAEGQAEFIELFNPGPDPIPLFDVQHPKHTWQLSGGIEFHFPGGITMAPGEYILVSNVDASSLRATHAVNPDTRLFGPWKGALENNGERIQLVMPGAPETNGTLPMYMVDASRYEPVFPWPEHTRGTGRSIERAPLHGHGNDPFNWEASVAGGTPGRPRDVQAPLFVDISDLSWPSGSPVQIQLNVEHPHGNLQYGAIGLPPGIHLENSTGLITGIPTEPGVYPVILEVRDTRDPLLKDEKGITLTITEGMHLWFIGLTANGNAALRFEALPDTQYEIQATHDLTQPAWHAMEQFVSGEGGWMDIQLRIDPDQAQGFYRLIRLSEP
ncbi:MAG: lamin tail domain-containing protein [Verrucomicrobiota bacterium]|nr:lamin tail domain-containing protein [Verrucomicrobiota bacterium]